ncbi:MAG: efflux RND transporter periplasmic adaptor subunit [Bryobacterales bacterium]|nr:efflux RND transporter periplasmic adaptor subunit [Bryobacterales bacterium]
MPSSVSPAARPQPHPPHSPAPEGRSRRPGWIILAAGLVVLAAGAYFLLRSRATRQAPVTLIRTSRISRGTLLRTVRASGQTAARDFASVRAPRIIGPESGQNLILMKLAKGGAFVRKGELLAQLDGQSLADHVDDVSDTVRQAEADVRKRAAEQAVEYDQIVQTARVVKADLDKSQWDLKALEIRTGIDQELLKLAVDENQARYKESIADLKNKKDSQRSELRILEITSLRQRRHRDRHAHDLTRFTIMAPMDGLVVLSSLWSGTETTQVQEGDQVYPGQLFMKIVNTGTMQVEATVNQSDCTEFRIGQPAVIQLDAFPGLRLKGHIYSIGALAISGPRQNFYIRNVPIRIKIDESDPRLIPDLSASADVEIERKQDAVICRRSAIRQAGGQSYVMLRQGAGFVRRDVKTGVSNEIEVEILAGLEPGDEVRTSAGA